MKRIGIILLVVLAAGRAAAEPAQSVGLRVGFDDAFVAELGYARAFAARDLAAIADAEVDVPWDHVDAGDWRARIGLSLPFSHGHWRLVPRLAPTVRASDNDTAHLVGLGADLSVVAGYHATHWFAAAELGLDAALAVHVTPSSTYRMLVDADARTGWYSVPGGELRYGLAAGAGDAENLVTLRAGLLASTAGAAPLLPMYATLGYARAF